MPTQKTAPHICLNELPDLENAVALHGARLDSSPALGVSDDLWIIAVIMVYEK